MTQNRSLQYTKEDWKKKKNEIRRRIFTLPQFLAEVIYTLYMI